jgi:hypothetical protein
MAKKANITGRSTMNKGQLITALSTLQNLTSAVVEESKKEVVEKKILEEKKLESKLAGLEPETRPDFIKTINERLKVLRTMVPESRLNFVPSNAKIRSMPKRALENLHIRLGNLEGDVLDEQLAAQRAAKEEARKLERKTEVERKLSMPRVREERKVAPSAPLAAAEKQRRAQEQLQRVARTQEIRREKELEKKADKFRLQQQLKRFKSGLDDAKWREVLRLVSESEMKENEEYREQFERAAEVFDSEMKTIDAKEKAENKAIRDAKAKQIAQKANDKLRQRAFEVFKEKLEIRRRASEVITSAVGRENRRDALKQALESKVATTDRLRREEIARQEALKKLLEIISAYKSRLEQTSNLDEIKGLTKTINEGLAEMLPLVSSDQRQRLEDAMKSFVTTRIRQIEDEAKRIADELIAEEEKNKPRAPPKKPKPAKKDVGDLARKIDDLRTELRLPKKESYKQLTTFAIDKLENMIVDLEQTKKQREEQESARQRENARRAIEEEKDKQDDADSKRRTFMYNILQKSKPQITYKNLLKLSDSKIAELSKDTDEKWNALKASQQKRNYVDPSLDLTKKPIREERVTQPAPAPQPAPASQPVPAPQPAPPIRVPQPPGSASTRAPSYVTAQPNTGYTARQGDTPIMEQTGIPPSESAPASAMAEPAIEDSNISQTANGKKKEEKFGIDNHTIDEFLSKYGSEYLGCIAHDEIPSKIYPKVRPRSRGFFVINTDPSWKGGEHWQCIFYDARPSGSGSIEFYDSFADPIDKKLQEDLKGIAERLDAKTYLKLKENRVKQQHDDSDNCGYFCMNFITSRMRGKPFTEASGFDESVKGENDIHKFKKQNGFGFLPSFGSISTGLRNIAQGAVKAVSNTAQRVRNVGQTIGNVAQNIKEQIFFPEKKLPSVVQPTFEKYKNFRILSAQLRREPILAFVDKFINLISFGKFNQAKKDLGYDKMFHLSLILQLENGPKLLVEKNERINMTTSFKDGPQVQYSPPQGVLTIPGNPTLGEFYDKTLKAVGEHQFFTYNAFQQNCQAFIADLLRSNGALTPEAQTFVMQDAQTVIKQLPFYVSKIAQFATDTAGRVRQFFGFGSSKKSTKKIQRRKKFQDFMNKIKKSTIYK